jgi:hypothetical protein
MDPFELHRLCPESKSPPHLRFTRLAEWPARFLAPFASKSFATHLSTGDPLSLLWSSPRTGYLLRLRRMANLVGLPTGANSKNLAECSSVEKRPLPMIIPRREAVRGEFVARKSLSSVLSRVGIGCTLSRHEARSPGPWCQELPDMNRNPIREKLESVSDSPQNTQSKLSCELRPITALRTPVNIAILVKAEVGFQPSRDREKTMENHATLAA